MKFLIVNMFSFRNKGCEAFTKGIIDELSNLCENAQFKIFTNHPYYDELFLEGRKNVTFLHSPFGNWCPLSKRWQYRLAGSLGISGRIKNSLKAFHWADVAISTDDVFSSTYGALFRALLPVQWSTNLKIPTFLLGHSTGPFEKEREYNAYVKVARKVRLITARESITFNYLKGMDLRNTKIELTADPAFCLNPCSKKIDPIWKSYGIPSDKTLIGIAPSKGIASFGKISSKEHFNALKELAVFLLSHFDCHILLFPHVEDVDSRNDDRVLCQALYRELGYPENVTFVNMLHSAEEIRAILGRLDAAIVERMHAAIASLSQNVPTIDIGYSIKSEGILSDIFGASNFEDYLVRSEDLNIEILKKKAEYLLNQKKDVVRYLERVIPKIKEKSKQNFTLLMDELKQVHTN